MVISRARYLVLSLLAASLLLSAAILAVDDVLWKYGASHAYGLVGFTVLDAIFIVLLFLSPRRALLLAGIWGVVQLVILAGNLFVGAQFGVMGFTQEELAEYFLGFSLAHGGSQIAPTFGFYKISRYSYDVLLSLQALLAVAGLLGYRGAATKEPRG